MKLYTKSAMVVMMGLAISFSACQKDAKTTPVKTTATTTTTNYASVSSAVAANFTAALAGQLGGANINEGLTPSFAKSAAAYPSGASALCGFVADSNIFYKTNIGDTIKSTVVGASKFYFDCLLGKPVGYTLVSALVTTGTAPGFSFTYDVAQGYQIESLNATATELQVDGTLQAYKDFTYTNKAYKAASEHDSFVITNAVVDISSTGNSINAGSATFKTAGSNAEGQSWNYVGTMVFIGGDIGKLTFYGNIFYVDLKTGKIVTI
jgi:hypothetical protein